MEADKGGKDTITNITNRMLDHGYPRSDQKTTTSGVNGSNKHVAPLPPAAIAANQGGQTGDARNSGNKDLADDFFGVFKGLADNVRSMLGGPPPPSPIANETANDLVANSDRSSQSTIAEPTRQVDRQFVKPNIDPAETLRVKSSLSKSIQTLRSTQDSSIQAQIPSDPPVIPSGQSPVCQILADNDLILINNVEGLPFFRDRRVSPTDSALANMIGIQRFVKLLKVLSKVYGINLQTISIYLDVDGSTIAFNRGKSLFFNARYYLGLHLPLVKPGTRIPGGFDSSASSELDAPDAYYYW